MFNTLEPLMIAENYQPSSSMLDSPITPFNSNKRSYCFPDNASTSSGPSVNSYLRKIYGDSASTYTQSRMNSNNNNSIRNKSNTFRSVSNGEILETDDDDDDDDMTSTTMDPEERKILVNHLNEYSFETLRDNANGLNKHTPAKHSNDDLSDNICPRTPSPENIIGNNINNNNNNTNNNTLPSVKNQNVLMRQCSIISPQYPTNLYSNKQSRKSNDISLSKEFDAFKISDDSSLSQKEKLQTKNIRLITPFERFKDIYMDEEDSPISPLSYPHHMSPTKTYNKNNNTNEQTSSRFGSFKEVSSFNNIMNEG